MQAVLNYALSLLKNQLSVAKAYSDLKFNFIEHVSIIITNI